MTFKKGSLRRLFNTIAEYMPYDKSAAYFLVPSKRSKGVPFLQKESRRNDASPLTQEEGVYSESFELSVRTEEPLGYFPCLLFDCHHFRSSIMNCLLTMWNRTSWKTTQCTVMRFCLFLYLSLIRCDKAQNRASKSKSSTRR